MAFLSIIIAAFFSTVLLYGCYNTYLHPLRAFPGPRLWAAFRLPYVFCAIRGNLHNRVCDHFNCYGPVVRIAPNELAFAEAEAWKDIYGLQPGRVQNQKDLNVWPAKQPGWEKALPVASDTVHARLRKAFGPAFTIKAVQEQEPLLRKYTDLLITQLKDAAVTNPVQDMSSWYNFTTFDITGDLAFGQPFKSLENSSYHPWVKCLNDGLSAGVVLSQINRYGLWSAIEKLVPKRALAALQTMNEYVKQTVDSRVRLGHVPGRADIFNFIIQNQDNERLTLEELRINGFFIVLGGSETTASLLSGATWYLCKTPRALEVASKEVRSRFHTAEEITIAACSELTYLTAVLKESLRIFPPAPNGIPRYIANRDGQQVAGQYIPYGTSCAVHQFAANHYHGNFTNPNEFIPDRWLGDARLSVDRLDVVQPFSVGPRNCLGINLAHAEMRLVLAKMLWSFDMKLGKDSTDWYSSLRVRSVWDKRALHIHLREVVR